MENKTILAATNSLISNAVEIRRLVTYIFTTIFLIKYLFVCCVFFRICVINANRLSVQKLFFETSFSHARKENAN